MSNLARVLLIVPFALVSLTAGERDAALIEAAKTQDHQMVAALVEGGADVDVRQGDGATALHWAAYWDDQVMADLLITAKADVNASNDLGATALWLASRNRNPTMIATLLDAGANPNATLATGETPLMQASLAGDVASVRALLAHSANVNAHETSRDQTALMWAVSNGHTGVVRALLEAGADVHARSHASQRMVSTAARVGVVGGTVYDRDGVFEVGAGGYTALLLAARQGQLESARLLVAAGANVNDASTSGTSALVVAAHSGHTGLGAHAAVGTLLLEHGADPDAAGAGYTATHAAVLTGDLKLVKALLAHGADANLPLLKGTPVRRFSTDFALAKSLIGATPLWLAAKFGESDIMRALLDHGAEPQFAMTDGTTPLMIAISAGAGQDRRDRMFIKPEVMAKAREREAPLTLEAVTVLVGAGADVNAVSESGNTALSLATRRRLDDVVQLLTDHGATPR